MTRHVVGLYVDGVDVNYWKRIDLSVLPENSANLDMPISARFVGFKSDVNEIRSFVFATPQTRHASLLTPDERSKPLGSIHAVFFEAKVEGGVFHNQTSSETSKLVHFVSEGKKFWEQASVTTTAGRPIDKSKEPFDPLVRWSNISSVPLNAMTLYYHSQTTLEILDNIRKTGSLLPLKRAVGFVDLSDENDVNESVTSLDNDKHIRRNEEAEEDDVVEVEAPPRIVPVIDITDESNTIVTEVQITANYRSNSLP